MTTTQEHHSSNRSSSTTGYPSTTRHYSPTLGIYMHNGGDADYGASRRRISPVNYCAHTSGESFQNVSYSVAAHNNDGSTQATAAATAAPPSFAYGSKNMRIVHDSTNNAKQNIIVAPTVLRPKISNSKSKNHHEDHLQHDHRTTATGNIMGDVHVLQMMQMNHHRDGNETQYSATTVASSVSAGHHHIHRRQSNGGGGYPPRNYYHGGQSEMEQFVIPTRTASSSSYVPHQHHYVDVGIAGHNHHDHRAVSVSRSSGATQQKHCQYIHRGFGTGRRLRNDKYKTEMCIDFMYGRCRRGRDKCHFAHGENDLMPAGSSSQMPGDCVDRGASFQLCSNARAFVPASAARSGQSIVMQAVSDFKDVTGGGGGGVAPMFCPMAATTTMAARSDKKTKQSISTPFDMFVAPQMPSNVFFESIDHASSKAANGNDELPLPRPTSTSSSALPSNPWSLKGSSSDGSREWSPAIGPPKQPPGFAEHCDKTGKPSSTSPSGVDANLEDDDYLSMLSDLNCLDLGEERQSSVFFERH